MGCSASNVPALLQSRTGIMHSSQSPSAEAGVEFPPGVPNWVPGYMFFNSVVHVRRAFPGTIVRSLATTHRPRSALPIRPIFSEWETRETGPQLKAWIRPWWWRAPNQNLILDNSNPRGVYGSVVPGVNTPSGATMGPRSRITSALRVPAYSTTPPTMLPVQGSNVNNPLSNS
jgi:hypothetical protein